ncbi:hypothetical protein EAE96_005897 [Botrytis aclada]|nr:hypothetical protein EAE96_005897 [Botrytis aclada]
MTVSKVSYVHLPVQQATSSVGASTVKALAKMLQLPTFYVLERSATRFATQLEKLLNLNPQKTLVFLGVETSLISDIDAACKQILGVEERLDYLYMSQGCIPLNDPQCLQPHQLFSSKLSVSNILQIREKVWK